MSNGKDPWNIIGWGVIIYAVICALPFILVFGLIAYLEGFFEIIGKLVGIALVSLFTIVLTAIIQQRKNR